jgi:hypothetical protein
MGFETWYAEPCNLFGAERCRQLAFEAVTELGFSFEEAETLLATRKPPHQKTLSDD